MVKFIYNSRKVKLAYIDSISVVVCGGWVLGKSRKDYRVDKELSGSDRYVHYHDCNNSFRRYMGIFVCCPIIIPSLLIEGPGSIF